MHALPAFEAAARLGSFRDAAAELHLTPSAISHQIRSLEEAIGVPLFERLPRGLRLSEAGSRFAATVGEALARLEREAQALRPASKPKRARISMPDFVASDFVLPELARFRALHPEIDLEINVTMALSDIDAGECDAAVRVGPGTWGQLYSSRLCELHATVVAAPALAAEAAALSEQNELPMLCLSMLEQHTRSTLEALGLRPQPERALRVDNYESLVKGAEAGLGVTVLFGLASEPFRANERLHALSAEPIPVPFAIYFVCRPDGVERPELCTLRDWLAERFGQRVAR